MLQINIFKSFNSFLMKIELGKDLCRYRGNWVIEDVEICFTLPEYSVQHGPPCLKMLLI